MEIQEFIDSGILELYVFGLLTDTENREVKDMADRHEIVRNEILSIEKAVIDLSYSVSPHLSAENYDRIQQILFERNQGVVQMRPRSSAASYIGWAAAVILLFGLGYQYYQYNQVSKEVQEATRQRSKYEQLFANAEKINIENEKVLALIRDKAGAVVSLAGQAAAPDAYAKVYMNKDKKQIYVDVAGLPVPPEGKVYQVWALTLDPLTPTSIGIVGDVNQDDGIMQMQNNEGVQAFGITLEPTGGSPTPTMEQLYTLGKV
jgi:anti-sigma-K factor RskA